MADSSHSLTSSASRNEWHARCPRAARLTQKANRVVEFVACSAEVLLDVGVLRCSFGSLDVGLDIIEDALDLGHVMIVHAANRTDEA